MIPVLGALLPLLSTVVDRVIPDKAEAEKVKVQIQAQAAEAEVELQKAQIDLAKEDAKQGKGGYRWGAGWLCVISLGYSWLLYPLLEWLLVIMGSDMVGPPNVPTEVQYTMLMGMLGLAGVRSFDLVKGTRK